MRWTFILTFLIFITGPAPVAAANNPVKVEILYMNHGPMQPTIRNVKKLLTNYQGRVAVQWFDADRDSGRDFSRKKKIRGHIPMLILINDRKIFTLGERRVTLKGFPSGKGPFKSVEGNWEISDLRQILDRLTNE